MDPTCKFGMEYRSLVGPDPVLDAHVRNCVACQDQVFRLDA